MRAHRIRAFRTIERGALTGPAIDELFRAAEVLSEGGLDGDAKPSWYGSVMITFDLSRLVRRCRGLEEPAELEQVVDAVQSSVRVRIRAHRMACAEVYRRFPDRAVGTAHIESRFSREGNLLMLDIDLEAAVELGSQRRAT